MEPHHGYRDGEIPDYQPCPRCGRRVRVDRLDLVAEHDDVCEPDLTLALELRAGRRPKP